MSARVWLTIPSARPVAELEPVLEAWRDQGYGIALLRQGEWPCVNADMLIMKTEEYKGWATSINILAKRVLEDPEVRWVIGGGDDTFPDPRVRANLIAEECESHFAGMTRWPIQWRDTFGVMQPCGDDWADAKGRIIERFAGSPWMGREWCLRAYQGNGPMWPYPHNWADEELQCVAQKLGVFWQRHDVVHRHDHWARGGRMRRRPPAYMGLIAADYEISKPIFEQRKAAGWPGAEPLVNLVTHA
jgi:hypothetical protein